MSAAVRTQFDQPDRRLATIKKNGPFLMTSRAASNPTPTPSPTPTRKAAPRMRKDETFPYLSQLEKIREDAHISAQAYLEASRSAELWGRTIVFVPALISALAGLLVAVGESKDIGIIGVASGAIAATASFLGSDRRASSFNESARSFTRLRHRAGLEFDLAETVSDKSTLDATVRALRGEHDVIAGSAGPAPDRAVKKARKRAAAETSTSVHDERPSGGDTAPQNESESRSLVNTDDS